MINIEIGSLDKRIHIMKYQESTDEYGLTHQSLTDAVGNAIWPVSSRHEGKPTMSSIKTR